MWNCSFFIISEDRHCFCLICVNLTKIELNNLTQESISNFDSSLVDYLLSTYVNIDVIDIEINHRNGLIYILTHIKVKNNKM